MKILRKILIIIEIIITMISVFGNEKVNSQIINENKNLVKVGVLLYTFDDTYISLVRQSLEEIQKKNQSKVEFTFYDGKNDQSIQNQTIDMLIENKEVDLLLLNIVDIRSSQEVINKIKYANIPVVLFNREPLKMEAVQSYAKAYFVGTNAEEAGVLQGEILIDVWNKDKKTIDTNGDNIMQYVMLMGEHDNLEAIARTEYSISTINDAGIRTQELALEDCNWNREIAKETLGTLFLRYGNQIEVIISNNDEMAIGAIETLQKYGYNKGNNTKTIPVVGVDAIPAAQELIKQGVMTGSVLQDASAMAEASYTIGMNLVNHKPPLDGTKYKLDDTGVAVRLPYRKYTSQDRHD